MYYNKLLRMIFRMWYDYTYMRKLLLIKLGGSVITDKHTPYTPRYRTIERIIHELKAAKQSYIICHGSGSFGHTSVKKYGGIKGYKTTLGIATVSRDVMSLNKIIVDTFIQKNLPAVSFRPMNTMTSNKGEIHNYFFEPIEQILKQNLIPVLCGDIIWDHTWNSTVFSGEKILKFLARFLTRKGYSIEKIIQVADTYGVYDNTKKTIPAITKGNWKQMKGYLHDSSSVDCTGGMRHKVENALAMAENGYKTIILNGSVASELHKYLDNKKINATLIS